MAGYDFAEIEKKWQTYWQENGTFSQPNPGDEKFVEKPKFYILDMFPYPSGAGLHVGHPEGYTATDIVARYKRMMGFNVLHPMGYDAFGLPAQQYAVEHGVHPRETTAANIANIERQIKMFGFSYDWSRRVATIEPDYYRWTQWIFLKMFNSWYDPVADAARPVEELVRRLESGELAVDMGGNIVPVSPMDRIPNINLAGVAFGQMKFHELTPGQQRRLIDEYRLAYMAEVPVNWCPKLGTVLANEEVTNDGRSDRGDHPVYRKALKQWMLRITAYSDHLLEGLDELDWPESIKIMQRNWIGRSEGAQVDFRIAGGVGGTGLQPVPVEEFHRIAALEEGERPWLNAGTFEGFDPYPKDQPSSPNLMHSIRNLPHITMEGATYFVTFRTEKAKKLEPEDRDHVLNAMLHWHGERYVVYAAVILDDHVHAIIRPMKGHDLSDILHSVKRYSARRINTRRGKRGRFWQDESFDHIIRDSEWLTRLIYYICDNPVERRLSETIDEYNWLWVNAEEISTEHGQPFGHRLQTCATNNDETIRVYTTRPDTLFGATYVVLAPEHALVEQITSDQRREAVGAYVQEAAKKSELERTAESKEKTGVFTGAYAINPVNNEKIPVWVAGYVMMGYGTGAIMAVPAHDTRDLEFAKQFNLPIRTVVLPNEEVALKVPISTSYKYDGPIGPVVTDNEWSAIANSIIDEFRNGHLRVANAPEGSVRIILPDGSTFCIVANSEFSHLHDITDPEVFRSFTDLIRQRAAQSQESFVGEGTAVNSGRYDGLTTDQFKTKITEWLEEKGFGRAAVNYKLRDWIFSRQWYWGEPFPIVHCDQCGTVALPEDQLPLELPEMDDFTPAVSDDPDAPPMPPLAKLTDWVNTVCPSCRGPARRETNAMPQWAGSCWYYLRFLDPKNDKAFCDGPIEKYWMAKTETNAAGGVDLYVGGAEHAVLHLLYARFWHKVLYDLGCVSAPEPFGKLFNQGMIRSFAYRDKRGVCVAYEDVDLSGDKPVHGKTGEELAESVEKMSKSLKNVVNPDEVVAEYGSDTFRLYEMFMGPLETSKPWNTRDVPGVHRFCRRVWRIVVGDGDNQSLLADGDPNDDVERALHRLIKKVGADIEVMKFNTAIAAMMEFVNSVFKAGRIISDQARRFVLVLAPFAPHLAEELWQRLGHEKSLAYEPWPKYDESLLVEETIELAVQVNGKMRGRITVPADADRDAVIESALAEPKVAAGIEGKTIVKKIVVPGRLVNFVVK